MYHQDIAASMPGMFLWKISSEKFKSRHLEGCYWVVVRPNHMLWQKCNPELQEVCMASESRVYLWWDSLAALQDMFLGKRADMNNVYWVQDQVYQRQQNMRLLSVGSIIARHWVVSKLSRLWSGRSLVMLCGLLNPIDSYQFAQAIGTPGGKRSRGLTWATARFASCPTI